MPTLRLAVLLPALVATVLGSAGPASAEDQSEPIGSARVGIASITGGFRICVYGAVQPSNSQLTGGWTLLIVGVRGANPISGTWQSTAWSVNHCEYVYKNGEPRGWVHADFGYNSVGGALIAHSAHGVTWEPMTGDRTYGVDPRP